MSFIIDVTYDKILAQLLTLLHNLKENKIGHVQKTKAGLWMFP